MLKFLKPAPHNEWWRIAAADPQATFFQTPAWLSVAKCQSDKYRDASLWGQLESGVSFVLPLCSYSRIWPLKDVHSVYDGCYGGVISDGPISAAEHVSIWQAIRFGPFTNFALTEVPGTKFTTPSNRFETASYASSEVVVQGKSFEDVYKGFTKSRKEDYRRGVKHNLTFRSADPDNLAAEFGIFYDLYQETVAKRWDGEIVGDVLDRPFLAAFQQVVLAHPNNFHLWFVELDGEPISMATAFEWNKRLDGWVMASRPEHFKIKPAVFILTNILRFAAENRYRLFHFGPNGDNAGLIDFKRRFGAETVPYKTWFKPSRFSQLIGRLKG